MNFFTGLYPWSAASNRQHIISPEYLERVPKVQRWKENRNVFSYIQLLTMIYAEYSAVCIATDYGLGDRGDGVRVPVGSRISLLHVAQTGSEGTNGYRGKSVFINRAIE
jgi:hypothetical protein